MADTEREERHTQVIRVLYHACNPTAHEEQAILSAPPKIGSHGPLYRLAEVACLEKGDKLILEHGSNNRILPRYLLVD